MSQRDDDRADGAHPQDSSTPPVESYGAPLIRTFLKSAVLPRCSVEGCRDWVWNDGAARLGFGRVSNPMSDKCWYHHHGKDVPNGSR